MKRENIVKAFSNLTRAQLIQLDTCARCSLCSNECPTWSELKEPILIPGGKMAAFLKIYDKARGLLSKIFRMEIREGEIKQLAKAVYICTLCGRCMETCPFGIQDENIWRSVRETLHSLEANPNNILELGKILEKTYNPYGMEPETRMDWIDYVDLEEAPIKEKADILYFVGCTTSFKAINQEIAYSVSVLLNHFHENWTFIGEQEWCCGSPLLMMGNKEKARKFAEHNIKEIEKRKVKFVLTSCAGCYRAFKFEYPKLIGRRPRYEVIHVVQYLKDKINKGALNFETKMDEIVAYHDPCELSRLSGLIKEPREILSAICKNYVEIPEHGRDARCCGGGGLLSVFDNSLRTKISVRRIKQAESIGAKIITSACPSCKMTLVDGVKELKSKIEIIDIAELVARQLNLI